MAPKRVWFRHSRGLLIGLDFEVRFRVVLRSERSSIHGVIPVVPAAGSSRVSWKKTGVRHHATRCSHLDVLLVIFICFRESRGLCKVWYKEV